MSKLEKLKEKARSLEGKDPKGAIETWLQILKGQDEDGDPNPDLAIFNRIGDLHLKLRDPAQAADYYDQAVDKYAELGFHNNAIAMCNKVLRNAPGRQTTYLKLAKLYASKGFMAEAKQNFVAYAERMHKMGRIQHAFAALKELADISAESAHLRDALAEHLRMYGDPDRRSGAESGGAGADQAEGEGNAPVAAAEAPPLRDEVSAVEIPPPAEFEPTVVKEGAGDAADELASLPETDLERQPPTAGSSKASELPKVKPFVPKRPAASPPNKPTVEVPPPALEPGFESGAAGGAGEGDEQP